MSKYTEYPEKADELGKLINAERTVNGLNPLYCVPYLNECAMIRASEVSEYWSRTRPNGTNESTVINANILDYSGYGARIAAGSETAAGTFEQWKNQSGVGGTLDESITHMGIGVIYNPNGVNGATWFWYFIYITPWHEDDMYAGQYLPENHEEPKIIGAFENAEKLKKIVIPESVKKIGENSFSGTALESVKIASDCEYSESSFPENCEIGFYE